MIADKLYQISPRRGGILAVKRVNSYYYRRQKKLLLSQTEKTREKVRPNKLYQISPRRGGILAIKRVNFRNVPRSQPRLFLAVSV